jgi:hypothetical protein
MSEANQKLGTFAIVSLSTGESYMIKEEDFGKFKRGKNPPDFLAFTTIYDEDLIISVRDIVSIRLITPLTRLNFHGMQILFTEAHTDLEDIFNPDKKEEGWRGWSG